MKIKQTGNPGYPRAPVRPCNRLFTIVNDSNLLQIGFIIADLISLVQTNYFHLIGHIHFSRANCFTPSSHDFNHGSTLDLSLILTN